MHSHTTEHRHAQTKHWPRTKPAKRFKRENMSLKKAMKIAIAITT